MNCARMCGGVERTRREGLAFVTASWNELERSLLIILKAKYTKVKEYDEGVVASQDGLY